MPVCVRPTRLLGMARQGRGQSGKGKPPQGSGNAVSTILKKSASGGDQFFVRKAQVIGLGELLFFFGEKFTAGERCMPILSMSAC